MTNKRFKLTALFSMLYGVLLAQQSYTIKFDNNDYIFERTNNVLSVSSVKGDNFYSEDLSMPAVPYASYRIVRPSGYSSKNYEVVIKKNILYKNVMIGANPMICTTDMKQTRDTARLATSSIDSPILYSDVHSQYGYDYMYFLITPLVYDTNTRDLYFVSEITIKFEDGEQIKSKKEYDNERRTIIKNMVINPEEVDYYYPCNLGTEENLTGSKSISNTINNGNWEYVIITTAALKPSFQDLIEWKIQKGLRAKVFTLEEIYAFPTSNNQPTNQAKIKAWIRYMHLYSGLKYVLLGGDDSVVPVQYCLGKFNCEGVLESEYVPSDLYYATFSYLSPNWDYNGNGILGEYGDLIDMEPIVYLTRLPVKTSQDVQYVTEKIMQYEIGYGFFNPSYVNKMLFTGTSLTDYNIYNNSAYCLDEQAYSTYIGPYWNGNRDYLYNVNNATYTNLNTNNTLTTYNLQQLLNSGYHFFHMDCHGLYNSWNLISGNYTNDDALGCTNTSYTIIVTESCHSNAFDQNCLSKAFMNPTHGALAYLGSSRNGLRYSNEVETPEIGLSLLIDANFFKNLLTGYPTDAPYHYGAVAAYTKQMFVDEANVNETNGYRYLQFGINPLGDPEMPIYTSAPQDFTNVQISVNGNGDVTVSTGGITGCTIALTSLDNGVSYFNVAEDVSSYTFTEVDARCYVTITKHNYRPYQSRIFYPGIAGNSQFYNYGYYSIDVPNGCTVTWSFLNPNSVNNNLLTTLSNNSCLVNNLYEHRYIKETLVATIKKNNIVVATRTKNISTGGDFSALVHQQGQTINGTTYPTLNNTVSDGGHTGVFELNPVTITSSDFADAVFTITGYQPTTWSKNSNGVVTAVFPQISGGTSQTTTITGNNSVTGKIFQFTLHIQPSSVLNQMLNIYNNGDEYSISMTYGEDNELTDNWNLTIYNAQTGQVIYTQKAVEGGTTVNTSGWKSGVYVVQGQANGETVKEKILVK